MSDQRQMYSEPSIYSPMDSRPRPLSPHVSLPDSMSGLSSLGPPGFEGPSYLLSLETPSLDHSPRQLLPAFSSRQYNQLPTPQSPNNFAPYIGSSLQPSPLHHSAFASVLPSSDSEHSKTISEGKISNSLMMTPDSSPLTSRWTNRYPTGSPLRMHSPNFRPTFTPEPSTSAVKLESPTSDQATPLASAPSISPPPSRLPSPFAPRTPVPGRRSSARRSASPLENDMKMDCLNRNHVSSRSKETDLLSSSPLEPAAEIVSTFAGGEMERLRQVMLENRLAHIKEAENRRPDYLKREKRAVNNSDLEVSEKLNQSENDRNGVIAIVDSPNKGRRLTLFQETSEESFEESLMAGGYGRYRTTEWVRQPQPLTLTNASITGPSNVVALLEQAQEPLTSDKELRKRKRLEAFRGPGSLRSNLLPVELEGRGRVLIDSTRDAKPTYVNDISPSKKRSSGRKKKKGSNHIAVKEEQDPIPSTFKEGTQKPNWLDHEFPWRLRMEEMAGIKKVEDEGRLKLIEEFLDRDSDDDEDQEEIITANDKSRHEAVARRTGGKMVPLPAKPELIKRDGFKSAYSSERKMLPCDPADARTALLAKRSVRSLSYRLQRKQIDDDNEDEIVCICNGTNDGRQLVQCDGCETWYHLQCIGIKSIDELGREEDPWFCHSCRSGSFSELEEPLSSEPTFVPTDDEPRTHRMQDAPFFQPSSPHNSPSWSFGRIPRTPTHRHSDLEPPGFSSGSSWVNSSHHGPSTPRHTTHGIRVYNHDSSTYNRSFEESPFDPTSTPSRGIKFGVPFLTPRNAVWSTRPAGFVQTPSKQKERDLSSSRGGLTILSSGFDGSQRSGGFAFGRFPSFDESPIRRSRSGEEPPLRRCPESPLASRSHPRILLEESPIVRSKGKEKL